MTEQTGENKLSKEYKQTEEKKVDFENKLNKLLEDLQIPKPHVSNNIEEILSLSYEQLSKISPEECSIFSYQLKNYAFYIQSIENRYRNIERWAEKAIKGIYGREHSKYGTQYTKYEEKVIMLCSDNSYARKLNEIILEYGAAHRELYGLGNRIIEICKSLSEIRNNKFKKD